MIVTIEGIPVYDAVVSDEGTGMLRISLVDAPAVMSDFQAFSKDRRAISYAIENEEKRLVRGVVMRADFPIYRNDPKAGEYYIIYKADTIRRMAEKYLLESRQNEVNLMHEAGSEVDGVQMVQYFIKDTAAGVAPAGFDDIADGSLFAEFHVVNDDVWAAVKDGTFRGFSLEGVFDLEPEQDVDEVQDIVDTLHGAFRKIFNKSNPLPMSKLSKFKAALAKILQEFGTVTTDRGILVWDGDEDLKAGDSVFIEDAEGGRTAAADGDYITSDGKRIVVADGKVSEIVDNEAEVSEEEFGRKATDKGELVWDGEEDLAAGDEVFTEGEDGERTPAADGEYRTEDGKVIVVVDGKVAEIRDDEAEVAPEDVSARRALRYSRMKALLEESFNDKIKAISDALREQGIEGYVIDAGEDFAIVDVWDGEEEKLYRYDITFNEDGTVTIGDREEVKPAFVPVDDDARDTADDELQDLRQENATLRSQLEELKKKPAAKPAHEEFRGTTAAVKTGDKGLDRLNAFFRK